MNCEAAASHSWDFTTRHWVFPDNRINSTHYYFRVWLWFFELFFFFLNENHHSKCSAASELSHRYCLSTLHVHLGLLVQSVGEFEPNVRPTGQRRLQPYFQWIHRCTYIPLTSSPPCTQVIAHGHAALSFLNHILLAALFQLLAGKLNWRLPPPTSPSAWCKAHPSQKVRVLCFSNLLFRI